MPRKSLLILAVLVFTFAIGAFVAPQTADALPRYFCLQVTHNTTAVATGTGASCAEATANLQGQLSIMDNCAEGTCNTTLVITEPCSCGCCQWTVKGYLDYYCRVSIP